MSNTDRPGDRHADEGKHEPLFPSLASKVSLMLSGLITLGLVYAGWLYRPGPDYLWTCQTYPCGTISLFGTAAAVCMGVAFWGAMLAMTHTGSRNREEN